MTNAEQAGDVQRSLELLWGVEPPPRRGPKPRVTAPQIVTTAIAIADAEGLDAVSMRKVAEHLGMTAMSIYSYVPNKTVLGDAMLDRVVGEMLTERPEDEHWRAGLHRLAHRTWTVYRRHPWALQISMTMTRRPFGPNILAALEATLRTVSAIGLTHEEMVQVVDTVDDYVYGAVVASLETTRTANESELTSQEWFERHGTLLENLADFDDYPTLVELWASNTMTEQRIDFEFGLERVLDGVEYYIERRAET